MKKIFFNNYQNLYHHHIIRYNFIKIWNINKFFLHKLWFKAFYIYVQNVKIPKDVYVPKIWNFSYISQNSDEKYKTLYFQYDLYGNENSHHMICKLNLKGLFKKEWNEYSILLS